METSRREILGAGAAMTAMLATAASANTEEKMEVTKPEGVSLPYEGPAGGMRVYHMWAGEDGETHLRTVYNINIPKDIPAVRVVASKLSQGTEDWHTVPAKSFVINTRGDIEGEVSDGSRQKIGQGDLVFLEDKTGKGHVTRLLTEVAALFIHVADDFDFEKWLNEPTNKKGAFD
jgi:hypothetical protein